MSKADYDWTITISGRGPCNRGMNRDPDQQMLGLAERLEKSGQSIEITDFVAVPLQSLASAHREDPIKTMRPAIDSSGHPETPPVCEASDDSETKPKRKHKQK